MALSNTGVKEGFNKRAPIKKRKSRSPVTYHHVNDPAGRVFAIMVQLQAEQMFGNSIAHIITRDFKASGMEEQRLHDDLKARIPEYWDYYKLRTGNELTPSIVYDRWHKKLAYTNGEPGKGGIPAQSREHYSQSAKLRPRFPQVEKAFRNNRILTLDEMQKLGE